jgi:hypothetical protein
LTAEFLIDINKYDNFTFIKHLLESSVLVGKKNSSDAENRIKRAFQLCRLKYVKPEKKQ